MLSLQRLNDISSTGWLSIFLTGLLGFFVLRLLFRRKNFPPGPTGLPIVGYLPFLTRTPEIKLRALAEKYGDVMSFKVFNVDFIHLSSADAVREAFMIRGNDFSGRPQYSSVVQTVTNTQGIVPSEGETWKIHRRFALHTLRDFGFGKLSLEGRIQEIADNIVDHMQKSRGRPFNIKHLLETSAANVICSLLFDRHFKMDDPLFNKFMDNVNKLASAPSVIAFIGGRATSLLPLRHLPAIKILHETMTVFEEIVVELIKAHRDTFDPTFLRDYVDVYLDQIKKYEDLGQAENSTFTYDRLTAVAFDLFGAGTETTSTTIHWGLRILMFRPDIQRKIQLEIDEVIGRERQPSNLDRLNMPYTEATINEILRLSSIVPLGVFHCNPEETQFRNYTIPERTIFAANFYAIHYDPKFWPNPDKFDPTRFLDEHGKLEKKDNFYPFSVGKRFCLGETLARTELFIFLTKIFQRFTIVPEDGDTDPTLRFVSGITRHLDAYKLCAIERM